jgi:hypothetical protein
MEFGFSAHLSEKIHGKTKPAKKGNSATVQWDTKPDATFYDDINKNGWMLPDMDSEDLNAKAYRRNTLEKNQAITVTGKDGRDYPINAFFFICMEDMAGADFDFNKQVGQLIKCCIRACQRHDSVMAQRYPTWRGNEYSEYQEDADLLFGGDIVPMDRVLLNSNVCDFLIAGYGKKDKKISAENLLLYKTIKEEDKAVFSDVTGQGYCSDAIVFCGYPVSGNTSVVTINNRLTNSFQVLTANDTEENQKTEIMKSITKDVLGHIVININDSCFEKLKEIVDLGKVATNNDFKQAVQILDEKVAELVSKLQQTKKRKATLPNTQGNQGGRGKGGRSTSRKITGS